MLRKIAAGALVAGKASPWLATSAHSIKAEPSQSLLMDRPDYRTAFAGDRIDFEIPPPLVGGIVGASHNGVTAGLKLNGNLSLPGKVMPAE